MADPIVGIIMGSDSDLGIMKEAAKALEEFDVPFEMRIISAHRWPEECATYARSAKSKGIRVLIAGAGGAAHLPGVVASWTPLPVIGVPIGTSMLSGVDSLYAIVQMPPGVPVSTVGINGARNAALLTIEVLALTDGDLALKYDAFREQQARNVAERDRKLQERGWKDYDA